MRASAYINTLTENSRQFEARLRAAEKRLSDAVTVEIDLERKIASDLRTIAALQIDHHGRIDGDAKRQLDLRRDEEASLRDQLTQVEQGIAELIEQAHRLEPAVRTADALVEKALAAHPEYVQQLQQSTELQNQERLADASNTELLAEITRKLPEFELNPLYRYLKECGYGTDSYQRTGILRNLDSWIALKCNFQQNHASEMTLQGMRTELHAATRARKEQLQALEQSLAHLRSCTRDQFDTEKLRKELSELDTKIKEQKKRANDIHASLAEYTEKRDSRYQRARDLLADALKSQPLELLLEQARQTPDTGDERLVEHVGQLQAELKAHRVRFAPLYGERDQAKRDYERAKELERTFGGSRYAGSDYEYSNRLDLTGLISGYMAGQITAAALEGEIKKHRKKIEDDDSPSMSWGGGYGRSSASSGASARSSSSSSSSDSDSDIGGSGYSTSDSSGGGSSDTSDSF